MILKENIRVKAVETNSSARVIPVNERWFYEGTFDVAEQVTGESARQLVGGTQWITRISMSCAT